MFDIISDERFLKEVAEKGEYLASILTGLSGKYGSIREVRGKGLLLGILVDFPASEAVDYFEREHILICSAGPDVVRFIPPLIISKADIDRVVDTLDTFLAGR